MTLTKRDLSYSALARRRQLTQQQVLDVVQKTLDYIAEALSKGDKVELRNFGVFEVKTRKRACRSESKSPSRPMCRFPPARW
jgi:nucleoid DNA-binding protein